MNCKVAIVGTEGTGKTVLMTVWATAFLREQRGISLIPKSSDTAVFVSRNWEYLTRGDWPPSTREGSLLRLHWELRVPETPNCVLEFREISGQDFRFLFGEAAVDRPDELPAPLRGLLDSLAQAQICVLLVNLADFTGQANIETREKSQWAIKYSLDWLLSKNPQRKCLLLFTQSDLYERLKDDCGDWTAVARKYLPIVYTSHIVTRATQVHAVSAIGNTRLVFDADGTPRRVPDTQWHCRGLIALSKWIGKQATHSNSTSRTRSAANPKAAVVQSAGALPANIPPYIEPQLTPVQATIVAEQNSRSLQHSPLEQTTVRVKNPVDPDASGALPQTDSNQPSKKRFPFAVWIVGGLFVTVFGIVVLAILLAR